MSEILAIGGYALQPDMAHFRIDRNGILSGTNRINRVRNTWHIWGRVNSDQGASGATAKSQVDARVIAVESAVREGMDLVFSLGSTMRLISSALTEGTHVRRFTWTTGIDHVNGSGAEGLLRRTFELEVYGDIPVASDTQITQWQDSITALGTGGPLVVPVGSLSGGIQAQQVQAVTAYHCIQSGMARGFNDYPLAPVPNFLSVPGVYYDPESLATTRITPQTWGRNANVNFGVRWHYKAWSAAPLLGNPQSF